MDWKWADTRATFLTSAMLILLSTSGCSETKLSKRTTNDDAARLAEAQIQAKFDAVVKANPSVVKDISGKVDLAALEKLGYVPVAGGLRPPTDGRFSIVALFASTKSDITIQLTCDHEDKITEDTDPASLLTEEKSLTFAPHAGPKLGSAWRWTARAWERLETRIPGTRVALLLNQDPERKVEKTPTMTEQIIELRSFARIALASIVGNTLSPVAGKPGVFETSDHTEFIELPTPGMVDPTSGQVQIPNGKESRVILYLGASELKDELGKTSILLTGPVLLRQGKVMVPVTARQTILSVLGEGG